MLLENNFRERQKMGREEGGRGVECYSLSLSLSLVNAKTANQKGKWEEGGGREGGAG